jgi:outer membrane protein OmpA-like peptidoglycan-associated protein
MVTDVLGVAALEVGDPVARIVLMKSDNLAGRPSARIAICIRWRFAGAHDRIYIRNHRGNPRECRVRIALPCGRYPERIVKNAEEYMKIAKTFLAFGGLAIGALVLLGTATAGADELPAGARAQATGAAPTTVSRSLKALTYRRAGKTVQIDFVGTELMRNAAGTARVDSKPNRIEIDARFTGLDDATRFGLEYLTYVVWAVSPQGRAVNLGELQPKNGSASLKAVADMQTFGMIVTAEPYYAVTQPGDEVVLENALPATMASENIDAKYTLVGRGSYASANTKIDNAIFGVDRKAPIELFEARNAVRIARNALADTYATSTMTKAEDLLKQADAAYVGKKDRKGIIAVSRNAVETAEEARVIAVQKKSEQDAQLAQDTERKAAAEREAKARADAAAETLRRQEADQARAQAEAAQADAERMKQQADQAAQQAAQQQKEAEAARAAALAQQQSAEAQAEQARQAAAQAEKDKADIRAQLLAQLNAVLQTQDTARGLIVNMSDVLFDTGSYTLKTATREKLAKISGIVLAHPGLSLQIEGHTDSVGSDQMNQQLSERRADSVRDFLVAQGVAGSSVSAKGFGKADPVASNDTAEGRQKNRRVELVVNGDAIGKTGPKPGTGAP